MVWASLSWCQVFYKVFQLISWTLCTFWGFFFWFCLALARKIKKEIDFFLFFCLLPFFLPSPTPHLFPAICVVFVVVCHKCLLVVLLWSEGSFGLGFLFTVQWTLYWEIRLLCISQFQPITLTRNLNKIFQYVLSLCSLFSMVRYFHPNWSTCRISVYPHTTGHK